MKTLKYILSIGIAAGAGLAIGILTAPRSGKRTRERLLDEFEDTKKAIDEVANKKLREARELLNKTVEKQRNNGKEAIHKLKETISR